MLLFDLTIHGDIHHAPFPPVCVIEPTICIYFKICINLVDQKVSEL